MTDLTHVCGTPRQQELSERLINGSHGAAAELPTHLPVTASHQLRPPVWVWGKQQRTQDGGSISPAPSKQEPNLLSLCLSPVRQKDNLPSQLGVFKIKRSPSDEIPPKDPYPWIWFNLGDPG